MGDGHEYGLVKFYLKSAQFLSFFLQRSSCTTTTTGLTTNHKSPHEDDGGPNSCVL